MHYAPIALVVVYREVQRAAVVPERERSRFPAQATDQFGPGLVFEQGGEQGRAPGFGPSVEVGSVAEVDV